MADLRNKPEIETLSYEPKCAITGQIKCNCADCNKQPSSAPPTTLGLNSAVIKPETRVNKAEDAGQTLEPLEYPEMCKNTKRIVKACRQVVRSANDYDSDTMTTPVTVVQACEQLNCVLETIKKEAEQGMIKMGFEQPNQDLMIITEIEGLMSQVNDKLESLNAPTVTDSTINEELRLKSQALEDIDIFQKTTLFKLRKAFE